MKEALKELQIACNEEDGQALYLMGKIEGGRKDFFKRSALAGCPWGMFEYGYFEKKWIQRAFDTQDPYVQAWCYNQGDIVPKNMDLFYKLIHQAIRRDYIFVFTHPSVTNTKILERGVYLGDADCMYELSKIKEKGKFNLCYGAYLQGHKKASLAIANYYFQTKDFVKAAKLFIKCNSIENIYKVIFATKKTEDEELQEMFIYGKLLRFSKLAIYDFNRLCVGLPVFNYLRVYNESTYKTLISLLCFLWCVKDTLPKDVRQKIGRLIWKTRKDPIGWGVKK
jgi:tetratricopeptide (TPR) repeat protein